MSDDLEQRVAAEIGEWVNYGSDEAIAESARRVVAVFREAIAEEILTLAERQSPHPFTFHERNVLRIAARLVRRGEQQ